MPSILTNKLSVEQAKSFVDKMTSGDASTNLYVAIAKDDPSGTWPDDNVPPAPADKNTEENSFRSAIIGYQKIAASDISLVVPRVNWESNTEYFLIDDTAADPTSVSNFYVLNSENRVYQLVGKGAPGSLTGVSEPTGTGAAINLGDGYVWKFLYNLETTTILNLLMAGFTPVNYGNSISSEQTLNGDEDAWKILGADHVLIRAKLESGLPYDINFRQVALVLNPVLSSDGTTEATGANYTASDIVTSSGEVLYIENRSPTTRVAGQSEEIKIVLEF